MANVIESIKRDGVTYYLAHDTVITLKQNGQVVASFTLNQATSPGDINFVTPTKTSDLENDSGFIDNAVDDLVNYYLKTETYTKAEIESLISAFGGFEVVEVLPTEDIKANIIYLLGPIGTGADQYEEWIFSNGLWTKIGETSVDLTNYFNKETDDADDITEGNSHLFMTPTERTTLSKQSGTNTGDETQNSIKEKLGVASASADGYLKKEDWSSFNGKAEQSDIGNGTISVTQAGTNKGSFTTNQSTNGSLTLNGNLMKTATEYANLPDSKSSDGNTYFIYSTNN